MKNIIHTLTLAQMRANPRRTLVTLAGVILSVAMLTAVFAGADSFLNLLYRQGKADNGAWQGKAFETGEAVAGNLARDKRIEQLGLAAGWGLAPLDETRQWGAALYGVNEEFYNLLGVECLEGSLPSKGNELAISRTLAEKTGWKPGDKVSLELLRVYTPQGADSSGTMTYRQRSGFGIMWLVDSYEYQELGQTQFTVTAVVDPGGFDNGDVITWEPCFTALEGQIPSEGVWCAYFTLEGNGQDLDALLEDIREWQGALPSYAGGAGTIELNRLLLLYYGMDYPGAMLLPAFYGLMGVVLVIILVGAVSLARNAFAISMAERTQMLGMLASVGATRAQKRQSVLWEAFVLGLAGIPLGLAAGCVGMAVTLPLVNQTVQEMFQLTEPLYLSVRVLPLAAAAALAAMTLALSALQPARAASRVGPMEAIRGEGTVRLTPRELKTGKLTGKLFGFTGALALKNCKRNRSRYTAIVFSLALSIVMLLAGSGLSYYVDRAMGVRYGGTESPLAAATMVFDQPGLDTGPWLKELEELPGAGESMAVGGLYPGEMGSFTVAWEDLSQEARSWIESQNLMLQQQGQTVLGGEEGCPVYPTLLVLEDEAFTAWAGEDIVLDPEYLDCIMVTDIYMEGSGARAQLKDALEFPLGFTMEFTQETGFGDTWRVVGYAQEAPGSAAASWDGLTLQLVTSKSVFQAFLERQAQEGRNGRYFWEIQYLHPESISALADGLEFWASNLSGPLPEVMVSRSFSTISMAGLQRFGKLLQIFCSGFVALLCLVCGANIHNTLSTGMELRSREYAILRSVGVTPKKFRQILWLESLFYGIKALCWGLPIGIGALALEYCFIQRIFYFSFALPVGGILRAIALVFGVCVLSGLLTRRRLEEKTIVEAIQSTLY